MYGYSELTTKVICGFRDALIDKCLEIKCRKGNGKGQFYDSKFEKKISKQFKIFICDGQPKTQTSEGTNYVYHDAIQYALYLNKRNFNDITIIPDIISGTILNCYKIDFLIVGANGIECNSFRHSGGHLGIIKLAASFKNGRNKEPKIILVTTTEKIKVDPNLDESENPSDTSEKRRSNDKTKNESPVISDVEGFKTVCLPNCGQNRSHIWLMKDIDLISRIHDKSFLFANPREDKIRLKDIDYIILDNEIQELATENDRKNDTEKFNVKNFQGYLKQKEWEGFIKFLKKLRRNNKNKHKGAEQ